MSGTIAPFATITDTDRSPVVLVCVTIGFCLSLLTTGIRVWITVRGKLAFRHDDFMAFAALVRAQSPSHFEFMMLILPVQIVAIGSSVMLSYAAHDGLGKHMSALTAGQLEHYFKVLASPYKSHWPANLPPSTSMPAAS
jgi:hypothetical protein